MKLTNTIILVFFISTLSSCYSSNIKQRSLNLDEYEYIDSLSTFEYNFLIFTKDNNPFFVLSKKFEPLKNDTLLPLKIGNLYKLKLEKNDTLKILKAIKEINIRAPGKPHNYWEINGKNILYMIGDSLVVKTYTSEKIIGFYNIK